MLVLTRRVGETIVIEGGIRITVLEIRGYCVRLGVTAPPSVRVDREEVRERLSAPTLGGRPGTARSASEEALDPPEGCF